MIVLISILVVTWVGMLQYHLNKIIKFQIQTSDTLVKTLHELAKLHKRVDSLEEFAKKNGLPYNPIKTN
jgi:hypothetical protein